MRKPLLTIVAFLLLLNPATLLQAASVETVSKSASQASQTNQELLTGFMNNQAMFLSLTPQKYTALTGKKLSLKEKFQLKLAQKMVKRQSAAAPADKVSLPQWAYILLALVGLGWLGIGLVSGWTGNDWWIALLLYFLFFIPGLIYTLIVMGKYY